MFERVPSEPFGGQSPESGADLDFGLGDGTADGTGQEATPSPADGASGGESAAPGAFYDASKVPPELQPTFREMQGAMTKKAQQLAEIKKQAEATVRGRSDKEAMLDQIMAEPRFVAYLRSLAEGRDPLADTAGGVEGTSPDLEDAVARAVEPHKAEIQRMQVRMALERERDSFVQAYPDWSEWKGAMDAEWNRNRNLTFEEAYGISRFRAALGKAKAVEMRANAPRASANQDAKDWDDAVRIAQESVRFDQRR